MRGRMKLDGRMEEDKAGKGWAPVKKKEIGKMNPKKEGWMIKKVNSWIG